MESIRVHLPEDLRMNDDEFFIYRPGQDLQELVGLGQLSGENVLPGFRLDLIALI